MSPPREGGRLHRRRQRRAAVGDRLPRAARLIWLALLLARPAHAPAQEPSYAGVIEELTRLIPERMQTASIPGLSIALIDGQRTVWARGFGHTDRRGGPAVDEHTPFSLQSISKTYTAVGVALAVERGRLRLDDRLRRHVPEFSVRSRFGADQADRITIRHLLSHRTGLPHEAPVGGNYDPRPTTFHEHIASIADVWLMFPVGARYSYSNLGIDLAGRVLERRYRRPFPELMRKELFEPLGMTASTFDEAEARRRPNVARGHVGDREAPDLQIIIIPSGGMYSTAHDMAKFVAFMLAGGEVEGRRLIRRSLLEEMATPQFRAADQPGGYGLGISARPMAGGTLLNHGGGGYGYSTMQAWLREHQVGVVVLSNQHSGVPPSLADTALRMMIRAKKGEVPPDPPLPFAGLPAVELPAEALGRLAGTYKPRGNVVRFEARDGALHLGSTRLTAHDDTTFTSPTTRFRFQLGPDGAPAAVEVLSRFALEVWPYNDGPNDSPGPNRPEWQAWVGSYAASIYGGQQPMTVSVQRGHLYTDWGGGQRLREYREAGLYLTADGEAVRFLPDRVEIGHRPFVRAGSR